jgi:crossover junction endodeoxyribonuclease RuvC
VRVLGVDPGTIKLGYGVVDSDDDMQMVDCGVLNLHHQASVGERLRCVYEKLSKVITQHHPDEAAIEEPFVGHNIRSALAIGRAQAVASLAAANQGLPVYYYSPAQIKQQVAGYGESDKQQMQEMVRIQLGLSCCPQPNDAADALAVAICHIQLGRLNRWLAGRR